MVIEVSFKGNRREFFDWPFEDAPAVTTAVVVEVERGEDLGHVHATGDLALKRKAGTTHGKASSNPLRKAMRAANGDEITRATQQRADEYHVRVRAIEKVRALGLDLKISDTEWQLDKKRLTVFFTAEQRVDFRQLVRQLEGSLGTRVHMWHIGVRDEAKRVDGVGRCGRQLCSASWLPELIPVKSSVAKDQHLSTLNPAQISGACGRLMCCLRYEHEFYVTQRKRFPKEGKIITTALGEEKVSSLDIFRETVTLRNPVGESRIVPLVQLRQEMAGEPVTVVEDERTANDGGELEEEVIPRPMPRQHRERPRPQPTQQSQKPAQQAGQSQPERPPREPRSPEQKSKNRQRSQGRNDGRNDGRDQRRDQPRDQRPRGQQQPPRDTTPASAESGTPTPGGTPVQGAGPPGATQGEPGSGRRRRRGRRGGRRGNLGPEQGGSQGGQQGGESSPLSGGDAPNGGAE